MTRRIIGRFSSYHHALDTVQDLLSHNIAQERIGLVAPRPQDTQDIAEQPEQAGSAGATGGFAALGLLSAATLALPGIGFALVAGPLAALLGRSATRADDNTGEDHRFQRMLIEVNVAASEEEARAYILDIRAGSAIIAVGADDPQEGMVAEILHRHGGPGVGFRRLAS